ncbi:unnamed protein product [Penicillium palitans]
MAEHNRVTTDTSSYPGISVVAINRPDRKNAVDPLTAKALYEAILVFEDDPKQNVCVLTGAGSRVVPKGESSCYYSAYEASSFQDAMSQEFNAGSKVISQEAIAGAAKFSKGSGRHGSFKDHSKL